MSSSGRRAFALGALILAGEAIFALPFLLPRVFRPVLLDVFDISNFELGTAFSFYGVVAMVAYFAGGPLADRFSPRILMSTALVTTAMGGIAYAAMPSAGSLRLLFGYWGLTTILLFWSALLKATRDWGGAEQQGRAFGLLDGGRGLTAAVFASGAVALFSVLLPEDPATATLPQRADALRTIIQITSALTVFVAVLVWVAVRPTGAADHAISGEDQKVALAGLRYVARLPAVWVQALIVGCAYIGFKSTDYFALYAADVFRFNDVEAASVATISFWTRPVAAVAAGGLSDRIGPTPTLIGSFLLLSFGAALLAAGVLPADSRWQFYFTVTGTSAGICALRGVYFAVFRESGVPAAYTGSAAGLVSVIGYTPDVFFGPLSGYLVDRSPGAAGLQDVFGLVAVTGLAGALLAGLFGTLRRRTNCS